MCENTACPGADFSYRAAKISLQTGCYLLSCYLRIKQFKPNNHVELYSRSKCIKKTRTGEHSEKPGRYSPIVRIHKQVIDPGESLTGDVFFTGYGEISLAKLQVIPSFGIFDKNRCYWWGRMKNEDQSDGSALITFGDKPHSGGAEHGITIHLTSGGIITDKWDRRTIFFGHAMSEGSIPQISTISFRYLPS